MSVQGRQLEWVVLVTGKKWFRLFVGKQIEVPAPLAQLVEQLTLNQ